MRRRRVLGSEDGAGRPALVALALVAGAAWAGCGSPAGDGSAAGSGPGSWEAAAERVRPSVHSVWGSRLVEGGERLVFMPVGTAFAVSEAGQLLTSAHVLMREDSTLLPRLSVLVQSDTASLLYPATVLGLDPARDLALLAIADTGLVPVEWARARAVMGAPLATIGYGLPEGGIVDTSEAAVKSRFTVSRRFTAGYSSSYRTLEPGDPSTNVLEVDLPLFPGVSGGPTFDGAGRVIGVNQGFRQIREGVPTSYGHVVPRFVVGQFLEQQGSAHGLDTLAVFHRGEAGGRSP